MLATKKNYNKGRAAGSICEYTINISLNIDFTDFFFCDKRSVTRNMDRLHPWCNKYCAFQKGKSAIGNALGVVMLLAILFPELCASVSCFCSLSIPVAFSPLLLPVQTPSLFHGIGFNCGGQCLNRLLGLWSKLSRVTLSISWGKTDEHFKVTRALFLCGY